MLDTIIKYYENETIEYDGNLYSKVDRLAEDGDLIVYPKKHSDWSSTIIENKPYLVKRNNSHLYFLDEVGSIMDVYGEYLDYDDEKSVLVYGK